MNHAPIVRGALLIIASEFMFASMGASIHFVALELDNEMIVFFRNLVGIILLLPWLIKQRREGLTTRIPHLHILRSLAGLGAMYCFFYAIAHMELAQAMLLKLSAPLFIPVVAFFWLGERITQRIIMAILVGFIGVMMILGHDISASTPVALVALAGGFLAALAKTTIRRLSHSEPAGRIVFYFMLIGSGISAIPLLWAWHPPSPSGWVGLIGVGVLATTGQLLLTKGIALAPISRLGPFAYSSVIFAAIYGWIFWQEKITLLVVLGSVLVITAGILTSRSAVSTRVATTK